MPKRQKKPGRTKSAPKSAPAATPKVGPVATPKFGPKTADEDAFIKSLVTHGQAAKALPDGSLPPGATHELVEDEHGELRVIRRRYSVI